ncbi:aldo/keto reductase [Salinigranum marinum]|uniref:aldo/keto reductase n=1 Tax=Salinigranum marinum TaxID=1515595 RepID=UPI002989A0CA|nr:aldo/keto reductase [Salinigranum marinum]
MAITNESDTFEIGGDRTVHRLGFGAMRITGEGIIGEPDDVDAAKGVLERAVELGVDFVDTADSYGPGVSERLIREALHPYDDVVVATKGGLLRNREGNWIRHADPDYLRNAHLCSLDRLGVDSIDLYQLHRPDPDVPLEASVEALAELKDDGVVEHVGLSNVSVDQLERARETVEIATVQNRYSVVDRDSEDVLRACEEHGIGFIPWFPFGGGDLGAKGRVLDEVAAAHDASRFQVALAWLLARSPVMLPIPGTSSLDHLAENVAASALELTDDELARLAD